MNELSEFYEKAQSLKADLKEVYYSLLASSAKETLKATIAALIRIQECLSQLIKLFTQSSRARAVLNDRVVVLSLKKWLAGLEPRVKNVKKQKKSTATVLGPFVEALERYLQEILQQLQKWIAEIESIDDLPRPPRD